MRVRIWMLLSSVVKVVLAAVAMTCLYVHLLLMVSSPSSPVDSGETGPAIGRIVIPGFYLIAVFIVSILAGLLLARDRWVVPPAATLVLLLCLYFLTLCVTDVVVSPGLNSETFSEVRLLILPMVIAGVIAFLFSPFFHDCGRVLKSYLKRGHGSGGANN